MLASNLPHGFLHTLFDNNACSNNKNITCMQKVKKLAIDKICEI